MCFIKISVDKKDWTFFNILILVRHSLHVNTTLLRSQWDQIER